VSLRFHKTAIAYYFASASPAQGIVIAPDSKTYHFKTDVVSTFNDAYTTTLTMPWSDRDYLVVFSGATLETETSYSFNANAAPNTDYVSNVEYALADEPANNRETGASRITTNAGATGYLHKSDIDYYKVNLGWVMSATGSEGTDSGGTGGSGGVGGGGTGGSPAFDAPANLQAAGTANGITLTWTGIYGSASYRVYPVDNAGNWSLLTTVNAPTVSCSDTDVNYGTVYWYKVCAINSANIESSFSGTVNGQKAPLAIPANFRVETAAAIFDRCDLSKPQPNTRPHKG
jgi:hypothetical protein